MEEYIEREAVFKAYMDLSTAKSKLAKARKGAAFFQSDLLPETDLTDKEWFRLIQAVPAADVAPVVHGRWVRKSGKHTYSCSFCEWDSNKKYNPLKSEFTYCPNCGARMDGE